MLVATSWHPADFAMEPQHTNLLVHFGYRTLKGANYTYILPVSPLNGKGAEMASGVFHIYFHL
jgi:hypothetical protein